MNQQKLQDLFQQLAKIDGVSLHERAVADFIKHKLNLLNLEITEDDAATRLKGNCGNLIVRIHGDQNQREPLLLLAHLDTVKSTKQLKPQLTDGVLYSDGTTILGADNRAGLTLIMGLLEEISQQKYKHRNLEIIFTVAEELGMLGALALDFSQLQAKEGFVFDCTAEPGGYVTATPTAIDFKINFTGRAAHSAVAPEKGINALSMALQVCTKFPVGRVNEHTVANIGTIHGGSADNVVPEQVSVTGEFRSFREQEINSIEKTLKADCQDAETKWGGQCELSFATSFCGFHFKPEIPIIKHLNNVYKKTGVTVNPMIYYGGSDANVFNANGIKVINLGIGANNPHSNQEHIALTDMLKGYEIMMHLIEAEKL
jgi:tripeptide aminopeptidase